MGQLILLIIGLLFLIEAFVGLPGSLFGAIIVPGNMVEGQLVPGTNAQSSNLNTVTV